MFSSSRLAPETAQNLELMRRIDEQWTSFYGVRTTVQWLRLQGNRPSFEVLDAIEGNDLIAVGSAVMTGFSRISKEIFSGEKQTGWWGFALPVGKN